MKEQKLTIAERFKRSSEFVTTMMLLDYRRAIFVDAFHREVAEAEQTARAEGAAEEAEIIATELVEMAPQLPSEQADWIRQRHAKPRPGPDPSMFLARPDIPHSSSLAYEARIREIAREEIRGAVLSVEGLKFK